MMVKTWVFIGDAVLNEYWMPKSLLSATMFLSTWKYNTCLLCRVQGDYHMLNNNENNGLKLLSA